MGVLHLRRLEGLTKDQRKLLPLIVVLGVLELGEYLHGFITVDVKQVADSIQATVHTAALVLSYFAIHLSQQPKDVAFAYGYERVETLAAFTNSLLIIFEYSFGMLEGLHHVMVSHMNSGSGVKVNRQHHSHAAHSHFGACAQLRLTANLIGLLIFFREGHTLLSRSMWRRRATLPPHSENMATLFLKIFGSVLEALVTLATSMASSDEHDETALLEFTLPFACSMFVVYLALPPLISCGRILLLAVPRELEAQLSICHDEVNRVDGVVEISQWCFWPIASERSLVGVVSVKIRSDDDENLVFREVSGICSRVCPDLTVQIVRD